MTIATTATAAVAAMPVAGGPLIGRHAGQRLARRELAEVGFWQRVLEWLARLYNHAQTVVPGGWFGLVALAVIAVLALTAISFWTRPSRARRERTGSVLTAGSMTALEYRLAAERLAAAGDYAGAIVHTVRAIAADLEERGILPPRPGRTADELAAEAGRELTALAADLRTVTRLFDDIRYGDRQGNLASYQFARRVDTDARTARLTCGDSAELTPTGVAAPW